MVVEIILVIVVAIMVMNTVLKVKGTIAGQDRCNSCKSKMKFNGGSYATVCHKCGNTWAKKVKS